MTTYHAPSPFMQDCTTSSRLLPPTIVRSALVLLGVLALVAQVAPPARAAAPVVAAPQITPFEDWAPAECPRPTGEDPAPTRRLVVHHTHEPVAHTPDEVLRALTITCSAHTGRGFSTIGYHYVVDPWGGIWQGRGALPGKNGRPPATQAQGAHVAGSNSGAVGVVFLGDHADEPPTEAALAAGTHLLAWLQQGTGVGPKDKVPTVSTGVGTARHAGEFHPQAISGHSDSNHTECPGEHLRRLLPEIRYRVAEHLQGKQPTSWAGLAVDRLQPVDVAPAPQPAVTAAPAPKPPIAKGTNGASAADTAAAVVPTPVLPSLAPLVSPVERAAGTLRNSGLLSLADRMLGGGM